MTDEPQDFAPPFLPLTIEPVSIIQGGARILPYASAGIAGLGALFGYLPGAEQTPSATFAVQSLTIGLGVLGGLTSIFMRFVDQHQMQFTNTFELTEENLIITCIRKGDDEAADEIAARTFINPNGYKAGVFKTSKDGPSMVCLFDGKGKAIVIATPLSADEAERVAAKLNHAFDYFKAPYHLREEAKVGALSGYAIRFGGDRVTPEDPFPAA